MAKQTGLGSNLYVAQYDLSGDIGSVSNMTLGRATFDVTSIASSATERIMGPRDGSLSYLAFWNVAVGASHLVSSALSRNDQIFSVFIGSTVGSAAASMIGKQVTYSPSRGADGSLTATINASANANGLEMSGGYGDGMLTTGKQTFASGTISGNSIDLVSPTTTAFGGAGYIHVFSLGSGTPTVTIQDAATEPTYASLIAFSAISGVGSERVQLGTTATVRRFIRIQVTGTYTNLVCAVHFVRYAESVAT